MKIYLDNSATTRVYAEVQNKIRELMDEEFGNAASLHEMGEHAEKEIRRAKEIIAGSLHVGIGDIYFTSGGTESNNWAIFGTADSRKRYGKHIITTCIEHPSVRQPLQELEKRGFQVTYLPVDENGLITAAQVEEALQEDTILVSVMMVNNEIGSVLPVAEIGKMLKEKKPSVIFHVDAIQSYGKFDINPKKQGIDLLSVSGHKLHGPKGIGFLYIADPLKISPLIFGGGQQKRMRSGTENVPGTAGLGVAVDKLYRNLEENREKLFARKFELISGLEKIEGTRINGKKDETSAPHIVSCSFQGVKSEVLLHALSEKGIYVSAGSACHSQRGEDKTTLDWIRIPEEFRDGTIRFSLSEETSSEEIAKTLAELDKLLKDLRRFQAK